MEECDTIKNLMAPLEAILVPIFFVLIGMQVKLESFLSGTIVAPATDGVYRDHRQTGQRLFCRAVA